jgi:hypothetical protein
VIGETQLVPHSLDPKALQIGLAAHKAFKFYWNYLVDKRSSIPGTAKKAYSSRLILRQVLIRSLMHCTIETSWARAISFISPQNQGQIKAAELRMEFLMSWSKARFFFCVTVPRGNRRIWKFVARCHGSPGARIESNSTVLWCLIIHFLTVADASVAVNQQSSWQTIEDCVLCEEAKRQ